MKSQLRQKCWMRQLRAHLREATSLMVDWWKLRCRKGQASRHRNGLPPGYQDAYPGTYAYALEGRYLLGWLAWPKVHYARTATKKQRSKRHYPFESAESFVQRFAVLHPYVDQRRAALEVARGLPERISAELALEALAEEP